MDVIAKSSCKMCHAECGIDVHIRDGKVVKVYGMTDGFGALVNKGKICARGNAVKQLIEHPRRLTHPLMRTGERGEGKWRRIEWDEALSIIANNLNELKYKYGAKSVLFNGGWGAHANGYEALLNRFAIVYGSPNYVSDGQYCFLSNKLAQLCTIGMPAIATGSVDYDNTDYVIHWANDMAGTYYGPIWGQIGYVTAKERGAKLVVIDPLFTATASKADIWIPIRPGTDACLAMSMLNVIINEKLYDADFVEKWTVGFEELKERVQEYVPEAAEKITWVSASQIRSLAREYATTKRAGIYPSFAKLGHYTNGFQTYRAIACLIGITNHFDTIGSNIISMPSWHGIVNTGSGFEYGAFDCNRANLYPRPYAGLNIGKKFQLADRLKGVESVSDKESPFFRELTNHVAGRSVMNALVRETPYPIKGWFEIGGNILMWPNTKAFLEAFKRLDFIISMNLFMNKSSEYADIVLPACSFLEKEAEATCRSGRAVMLRQRVLKPPGQAWDDRKFIIELAKRMGFQRDIPWNSVEEEVNEELMPTGLTVQKLKQFASGYVFPEIPMEYKKFEQRGFPTPSRKFEFKSSLAAKLGADPLPIYEEPQQSPISTPDIAKKYPLILVNKRLVVFGNSQWKNVDGRLAWCYEQIPGPEITMSKKDADARDIRDGDMVSVSSSVASIKLRVKVSEGIAPGVVSMPHDFFEANLNDLTDDKHSDPVSGFAEHDGFLVEVRKTEF